MDLRTCELSASGSQADNVAGRVLSSCNSRSGGRRLVSSLGVSPVGEVVGTSTSLPMMTTATPIASSSSSKKRCALDDCSGNLKKRERHQKEDDVLVPCCICMSDIERCDLSTIDGCIHKYCFDCIAKWSKTENSCPQCKARFSKICRVHLIRSNNGKRSSRKDPNNTLVVADRSQQDHAVALERMVFRSASGQSQDDDAVAYAVGLALSLQYVSPEILQEELARHLRRRGHFDDSEEEDDDEDFGEYVQTPNDQQAIHQYFNQRASMPISEPNEAAPPQHSINHSLPQTSLPSNLALQALQDHSRLQSLRDMERMLPTLFAPAAAAAAFHNVMSPLPALPINQVQPPPLYAPTISSIAPVGNVLAANAAAAPRHILPTDIPTSHDLFLPSPFAPTYEYHQTPGITINAVPESVYGQFSLSENLLPALNGFQHSVPSPHLSIPVNLASLWPNNAVPAASHTVMPTTVSNILAAAGVLSTPSASRGPFYPAPAMIAAGGTFGIHQTPQYPTSNAVYPWPAYVMDGQLWLQHFDQSPRRF